VKIFEALPIAGGMLAVGIPDYRLPKDIMNMEIGRIESMGVEIRTGIRVGTDISIAELKEQFDGVIVALGAHGDPDISIDGQASGNVLSGVSFLRDVNMNLAGSMKGKKVAVVGGGNVAIDAARSALRLSADEVTVVYRRDEDAMPAYTEEIAHAKEEGVAYKFLAAPSKVDGDKLYYSPMKLGAVDGSGRRRPEATGDADVAIDADIIILATGQTIVGDFIPNIIDMKSGKSVEAGVYVAGDCATGPKSVIEAVAGGRRSAEAIDFELGGSGDLQGELEATRLHFIDLNDDVQGRMDEYYIEVEDRVPGFNEVELGLLEDDDRKEAARCMHCGCINCMRCVEACSYDARQLNFPIMTVDRDLCRNCGVCISSCPTGALSATIVDKFTETDNTQNYLGLFS
jgi:NADH-quinone oxidoreductase subunit F